MTHIAVLGRIPLAAVLAGARTARAHGVRTILTPAPVEPLPQMPYRSEIEAEFTA